MKGIRNVFIWLCYLVVLMIGCSRHSHSKKGGPAHYKSKMYDIPRTMQKLSNLSVFSADLQPRDTVELEKEGIFKSNKNFYFNGYVGSFAVDNRSRVFIAVTNAKAAEAVYVFGSHDHFLTKIGQVGKGPGEFLAISAVKIQNDRVYVYDPLQYRISVFSLKNFHHLHDVVLKRDSIRSKGELAAFKAKRNLFVRTNQTYLMGFLENQAINRNKNREILYYRISKRGEILPGNILKVKRYCFYTPDKTRNSNGTLRLPRLMPFSRRSFVAVASNDAIFTNWSEHFLIKIYDKDGHYKRALYYTYKNSPLSTYHLKLGKSKRRLIDVHKDWVPDTWPAVHTMFMDDRDRLWVFTITDSKTHYKGWVLNIKGRLIARFDWQESRSDNNPAVKPVFFVKNGYLYKREINLEKGLNQVVKYKIQFKKNK